MKGSFALNNLHIVKEFAYSLRYLMQDKRKLLLAFLVFILIPSLNIIWKFVDPSISVPYYDDLQIFVWTMAESSCMILTSAAWYLSTAKKDYATKLIALASIYYWTFVLLNKLPFQNLTTILEEVAIFICAITIFTMLLNYIKNNYLHNGFNYKEEYDGMVYEYHHLCRGFTKTVEGLNNLKDKGYISEEEYNARLSATTERFDEFAMKIHDRYRELI